MAVKIHTGTIRVCPRCVTTGKEPYEFKGCYVPVEVANELERENEKLKEGLGSLSALMDALERRRCLFWTGNVLVELDRDFDVAEEGVDGVTMVLDDDDFAALKELTNK